MKFLWNSNAPWAGTGYGQQTKLMLKALKELGHDPTCFCFYGLSGGAIEYDGYKCLPNSDFEAWGNDVIKAHIERSEAEVVISLVDLFVLHPQVWSQLPVPWIAWTPIDGGGIGVNTMGTLKHCDVPVAMSYFGADEMKNAGVDVENVIYHAVDTEVFVPMEKQEQRDILGLEPDIDFLIGMVMANKGDRKQYPIQLEAIRLFMEKNPDMKVRVYLHTEPTNAMGGWDMRSLVDHIGLKGYVYSTNQYDTSVVAMPQDFMARMYNAFDVLMNCSSGEGFGIPLIEAQACGVPVIAQNVTAMPEIVQNGYLVETATKGLGAHFSWQYMPNIEDMIYRLDCVYRMADKQRAEVGRAWVEANCSVPIIAQQWADLITEVGDLGKVRSNTDSSTSDAVPTHSSER